MRSDAFSVLMICTGNIYRFPAAQYVMMDAFGSENGIRVSSAGTAPPRDSAVADSMAGLLSEDGIDASAHRARPLTEADVRDADLILGMTRFHRGRALALWPDAHDRTFTLNEFARLVRTVTLSELEALAGTLPVDRLAIMTDLAARRRRTGAGDEDDISDPHLKDLEEVERVFVELRDSVTTIVRIARGRRSRARRDDTRATIEDDVP